MIKYNNRLMHVNLDGTGLSRKVIEAIASAMRKAKSLQAIHLSHNPFLLETGAQERLELMAMKIRAKPQEEFVQLRKVD